MKGIDVSYHQGNIDWNKVKSADIQFVIPRCGWDVDCDGEGIEPKFLEYVKGALSAGIEVPAVYHMLYAYDEATAIQNAACAINAVRRAGLPHETIIFLDQEEHTVIKEKERGYNVTTAMQLKMARAFCNYIIQQGYATGIYLNHDYIHRVYGEGIVDDYDIWFEDHTNAYPNQPCLYRQINWHGRINGIGVDVDIDQYEGIHTKKEGGKKVSKVEKFIEALKTKGDGRYHYYDGSANSRGCSAYVAECLRDAGVIGQNETFHAGSGNDGVLAEKLESIPWNPNNLREGDILWSDGHHVAVWDGKNGVYEAAPEKTHYLSDNGKTGVGHFSTHGYKNCGTGTNNWTCIYRIKENEKSGKLLASEYVKGALKLLDRPLAYKNSYPYNCGLLDANGVTWGDCWNINPKTMIWSMAIGEPIWDNTIVGAGHVNDVVTLGIKKTGLQDVTGDYIMNKYCTQTTFKAMLEARKAPCLLLITGHHMGAYIGDFERDGKVYNVSEFSPNEALGSKMRSYVDEYGRRLTHKGGTVIGTWNKCGYLTEYLSYEDAPTPTPKPDKSIDVLAMEVYAGKWGNNPERKNRLTEEYGEKVYEQVQERVDHIANSMNWYRTEIKLAEEILANKWGNNPQRQNNITLKYGSNAYRIAQDFVNGIIAKQYSMNDLKHAYDVAGGILCGIYGNGEQRKKTIDAKYGATVRKIAQAIVNDILR